MNILVDTNVVLDLLLDRAPHARPAAQLIAEVERQTVRGMLCATTVTTVYYLAERAVGRQLARAEVHKLLSLFTVAPVDQAVLERALGLPMPGFEDAVLAAAGVAAGTEVIVTRNLADFELAPIPASRPEELLALLQEHRRERDQG